MTTTTRKQIQVSRLSTLREVDALQQEWRELEGRCREITPFSTWEWCQAVAGYYGGGRPLWVMTLRDGGDLIGIAPFAEKRFGGLRVLRVLSSALGTYSMADYQDLLLAEGREGEAVDALCDDLAGRPQWDVLHLQELPAASRTGRRMKEFAASRGWPATLRPGSDVHRLPISGSWEEYRMTLSRSTRKDGGRLMRKLVAERAGSCAEVDGDAENVRRAMNDLFDLHTQRWRSIGKPGIFHDERRRNFHREVARRFAERRMLAMSLLRAGAETIAVKYGFQANGTRYYYSAGFSPDQRWDHFRLGLVLDLVVLKDAFEQGVRCVDFMRGDGHYKDHYRMDMHLNHDLLIFRSRRSQVQYRLAHLAKGARARLQRELAERRADHSRAA